MAAYVISDVTSRDQTAIDRYRTLAAETILQYGGTYLVRGGATETWEGDWEPESVIVVEFPSADQARTWYRSPEYAAALAVSKIALRRRLLLVEGVDGS